MAGSAAHAEGIPVATGRDVDGIVTAAALAAFTDSPEVGMQVAVSLDGELIVDVAIGYADRERRQAVESSSLFPVFSVTKGLVSTAVLRAVDDGLLELDAPIGDYWPEFAVAGKQSATVAHILTHSVGIPAMPTNCTVEDMCDWTAMVTAVETMPAIWAPGTATGYHAYTYGWIAGELLRRVRDTSADAVTTLSSALTDIGVEEFWIGLPPSLADHVATLYTRPEGPRPGPNELFDRALPAATRPQPAVFNRSDVHAACLPAAGGIGTARALAHFYDTLGRVAAGRDLVTGEVSALSPSSAAAAAMLQTDADDLVLGRSIRKGLGFFLNGTDNPQTQPMGDSLAFGHPGSGGSIAWADLTLGVGIAVTKNWMAGPAEDSILAVSEAARSAAQHARSTSKKAAQS